MYRVTNNNQSDLGQIVDIYNHITGRNRTVALHRWEWFESPYENKSYVIIDKDDNVLGHHGILTIGIDYKDKQYIAGKTENTIMKKEYGPLYFKNEKEMHAEYSENYDILITTSAIEITKKIRSKLGYTVFSEPVTYIKIVDTKIILEKIRNQFLKKTFNIFFPLMNIFLWSKKVNNTLEAKIHPILNQDIKEIQKFYEKIKEKFGFIQRREANFLQYRILDNPYNTFSILKLYDQDDLKGYLVFYRKNDKIYIEDILFENEQYKSELLNHLFNYVKRKKIGTAIVLVTLVDSILDKPLKGYFRRTVPNTSYFMIKNNIEQKEKDDFIIQNFYFTKLMTEGIQ